VPLQSPFLNQLKRFARSHVPPAVRHPLAAGFASVRQRLGGDEHALQELARRHHALNRGFGPERIAIREHLVLDIAPDSRDPFEHFCFRSIEMKQEMDFFIDRMRDKRCLLDIGSLHGIFALVFCHGRPARAIAVEPSPLAFPKLMDNIRRNAAHRIDAFNLAASDRPGRIPMQLDWEHLVAIPPAGRPDDPAVREVEARPMDDLIREHRYPVDLIKIDVEGHEGPVLHGLLGTLEARQPDLFLELHPQLVEQRGETVAGIVGLLTNRGYRLTDLAGRAVPPDRLYRQADVFRIFATGASAAG